MILEISFFMAFSAGLVSFLSPCVLPLVPSYFSILAGVGIGDSTKESGFITAKNRQRYSLILTSLFFILGFSVVFIIMGFLINTVFFIFSNALMYINIAAGIIVIILGLNILFDFISFLNYQKSIFLNG